MGKSDTHAAMGERQLARFRAMTPIEKGQMLTSLTQGVEKLARTRLAAWFPNDTEREQTLRVRALWYGEATVRRVYGWAPPPQATELEREP